MIKYHAVPRYSLTQLIKNSKEGKCGTWKSQSKKEKAHIQGQPWFIATPHMDFIQETTMQLALPLLLSLNRVELGVGLRFKESVYANDQVLGRR